MRLMIAMADGARALRLEQALEQRGLLWDVSRLSNGQEALQRLLRERYDLLLAHVCLPGLSGDGLLRRLERLVPACPPRALLLCEPELSARERLPADCVAPLLASGEQLATLLSVLAGKEQPRLARASAPLRAALIGELLQTLRPRESLKGWRYIAFLLDRLVPSPTLERDLSACLYPACARAFHTTGAAVERCVRHAVEDMFDRAPLESTERLFGLTVDPERGKPTNRAFLITLAETLRARQQSVTMERAAEEGPGRLCPTPSPAGAG